MTGSPVFKFKPSSCKKQRLHRKISLQNVSENQSKQPHKFPTSESKADSSNQYLETKNETSGIQDVTNRHEPNKSISSSLSSFVFPSKKCAKRKLNFDVDGDNDDVSSLRFSSKNLSLCGFRSKTSSVADQRSLPDIRNAVQSPNKNRTRFSGSCRSSVGSVISCRRKLFTEFEESVKRPKLTSPILCQKTKSNKKEIKLSLKKKFPGVPNSDSARSGLLLNLAFSKYNLSNSKKEDVSVDFVGNASGCTTTKKDFVHYSHIKKDDSSRCRSPVFMAIKKVKRKLNLEDQSTFVSNKSVGSNTDDLNVNQPKDETPAIEPVLEKQNLLDSNVHCKAHNIPELERKNESSALHMKLKNSILPQTVTENVKETQDFKRNETSTKTFTPFSPIITKQTNMGNYSSSMEKLKIAKCKNNLFRNSKIRSTLRNKIFDLSKINANSDAKITNETIDDQSPIEDENYTCCNQINTSNKSGNIRRSGLSKNKHLFHNVTPESNEINVTKTCQSSKKICKSRNSRQSKKWINQDSFQEHNPVNRQFKLGNATSCDQKFLKSHMNRFLTDCLTFAGQRNDSDNEEFPDNIAKNTLDETSSKENIVIDDKKSPNKKSTDFIIENVNSQDQLAKTPRGKIESKMNKLIIDKTNRAVDFREEVAERKYDETNTEVNNLIINEDNPNNEQIDFTIENVDSQDDVIIENVDSQFEPIIIEPIESQNEFNHPSVDAIETDDVNSLLLESQNYTMSIAVKDCVLKKSTQFCSVGTDMETPSKLNVVCIPQITNVNSQKDLFECSTNAPVHEADMKIEHVSTSASYSCVRFIDENPEKHTPESKNAADLSGLLDTSKKTKKKSIPNTLTNRLDKLLNRENSDYRMWEYEMSKLNLESNAIRKPAVFCVDRMWKEYSHLILLCSYFYKDVPAIMPCEFSELKSFAKDVSNSIVIVLEQNSCPKNLSYCSVFQVHPPWKFLNFDKCAPLLMLKPRKISMISTDKNPVLYKDPTIPNNFIVTRQRELCSCGDLCCDCGLPDSYQFLIQPLLFPDLSLFNRKNFFYRHLDIDTFNSRRINDVLMKHKLFATPDLTLDVQVLHCHKDESIREFSFWYFVCLDEEKNLCCVLADGKTDEILPYVGKGVILKFTGISPWKLIPSKNVTIFLQYLNFIDFPDDVKKVIDSQNIIVFLLSNEYGNVECLD